MPNQEEQWQADAISALVKLVREEFPPHSLERIASTWGDNMSVAELAALARLDAQFKGEAGDA